LPADQNLWIFVRTGDCRLVLEGGLPRPAATDQLPNDMNLGEPLKDLLVVRQVLLGASEIE